MMAAARVARATSVAIGVTERDWPFAAARSAAIAAHFSQLQAARPSLWNGRVLLLHGHALEGTAFRGEAGLVDFASFIAWRDWDFPDPQVVNFFAMAALRASDGAFLLGVQGAHTANAGRVYFPAGTPDADDIRAGQVDLEGSLWRELAEETGLREGLVAEAQWRVVLAGPRIAFIKILQSPETASALAARVRAHLGAEPTPELADVLVVRGRRDVDSRMPSFVTAFLEDAWAC